MLQFILSLGIICVSGSLPDLKPLHVVDGDPEFIVSVNGISKPLCFNLEGEEGEIIRLIQDARTSITVNARLIYHNESRNTYIGTVSILRKNVIIIVKPHIVIVNRQKFRWGNLTAFLIRGHRVVIGANLLAVTFRNLNITAIVKCHQSDHDEHGVTYLGFYLSDASGFSQYVHGLLGQFLHKSVEIENLRYRNNRAKARLSVVSPLSPIPRRAVATLGHRMNKALNTSTPCWILRQAGRGVVDGRYENYVVESMRDTSLTDLQ